MTASRIALAFDRARSEGRAVFIPYLTAGDPSAGGTVALARALDGAGAGILELGVPFSDPIADGPVLQRAASRALAEGTTLSEVWGIAAEIRRTTSLALLLFSYVNPLLRRGIARAAREARAAGFDAVLVTDLPPEEGIEAQRLFRAAGLDTVFLVSPTSPPERMARAAKLSTGFLYVVSRAGTTGERDRLPRDLASTVARARSAAGVAAASRRPGAGGANLPLAVGFGVSTPRAAAEAARLADGVVVGSALVRAAEEAGDDPRGVALLARRLSEACRRRRASRKSL